MNLYSLISNYDTSNKYTYLNTYTYLFNVVTTIIRVKGLRIHVSNILRSIEDLSSFMSNIEMSTDDSSSSFSCLGGVHSWSKQHKVISN
jgi:hypothetical protein